MVLKDPYWIKSLKKDLKREGGQGRQGVGETPLGRFAYVSSD